MNSRLIAMTLLCWTLSWCPIAISQTRPVPLIFDTDIGNDAEAYHLYNPPPHNRPTWDLTSVLHAIRPSRGYFDLTATGRVTIADNGLTTFEPVEGGRDRHLILRNDQKPRTIEALVQLASQPPSSGTQRGN